MTKNLDLFLSDVRDHTHCLVETSEFEKALYSTDSSIYHVTPMAVLIPTNKAELREVVKLASQYEVPLVPRAGGTGMAGQVLNKAVVLDLVPRFDQILEVNKDGHWVRAEPGVLLSSLNDHLKPFGLKYGPDPASGTRAGLGGIVANNSSGSHSILYGMTADHILSVKMILWDGSEVEFGALDEDALASKLEQKDLEGQIYRDIVGLVDDGEKRKTIIEQTPRHWRRCGGYNLDRLVKHDSFSYRLPVDPRFNLAKLICGSEGTLGIMTEVKLNLVPLQKATALSILHFDGLVPALDSVPSLLTINPSAVELLDSYTMGLVKNSDSFYRQMKTFVRGEPNSVLITEFYGEGEADLKNKQQSLRELISRENLPVTDIVEFTDPRAIQNVWSVRTAGFGLLMGMKGDLKPMAIVDDAAVPVEHLGEYITKLERYCQQELGHDVAYFAHASAGCLHIHNLLNMKLVEDVQKLPRIMNYAGELLKGFGGVLSSEHGDGRLRSWMNPTFYGKDLYALFVEVKQIFDPKNIFNPGNIVNSSPINEDLRYGNGYTTKEFELGLDHGEFGYASAVEMCNGTAICRQLTGTMCPSYKATREEKNSTRGRANGLRAAISGKIALDDPLLMESLDLCVSCKACKSECPTNVDLARLKAEYLYQYYKTHGLPFRSMFFAHFGTMFALAGGWRSPIANLMVQNPLAKTLIFKLLRLAPQRELPKFAPRTFDAWFKRRKPGQGKAPGGKLLLHVDISRNHITPEVAEDAVAVLEACGYEVVPLKGHELGRAAFSKGDLRTAKKQAGEALRLIKEASEMDLPIISLEPSDHSMLVDDLKAMFPKDPDVLAIAERSVMLETFMWERAMSGALDGVFKKREGKVLLHGHCHQKALVGTKHSEELLAWLGYEVTEAGSGCCGMAGSFGMEAEHYEVSIKMGELKLLPAVRAQQAETLIVASGVSCTEQIKDGTGRQALHPARVLHMALK